MAVGEIGLQVTIAGQQEAQQAMQALGRGAQQMSQQVTEASGNQVSSARGVRSEFREMARTLVETMALVALFSGGNKELHKTMTDLVVVVSAVIAVTRLYGAALVLLAENPLLLAIAGIAALGVAAVALGRHMRDSRREVDDLSASLALAALRDRELNDKLQESILLQGQTAGAIQGITFQTQGLLGPSQQLHQTMRNLTEDAKEEAKAREAALKLEMDDIAAFNVWQRGEWEKAALFRQQQFIKVSDAAVKADKEDSDETVAFNVWQREQWQKAADVRTQLFITASDKIIAEQKRYQDAVGSALQGILSGTATFSDLWTVIWQKAVNKIIEQLGLIKLAMAAIHSVFGFFGLGFLGLQRGGSFIATGPTPMIVGEAGAELVSVKPLAGGGPSGGGVTMVFQGPTFWDDMSAAMFVRRYLQPVLTSEGLRKLT